MTTEKWVLVLLILMIIEQALAIAYNFTTRARNEATHLRNFENERTRAEEAITRANRLELSHLALQDDIKRILSRGISPDAVLITREGFKILPIDWQEHFDLAWSGKKEPIPAPKN